MNLRYAPDWLISAACRDEETELFFLGSIDGEAAATAICQRCSVRSNCLAYALRHPELSGIWGGTSDEERSLFRRAVN
jgi:WhiB family redox-sensing transcriptional regulator